MAKANWAIDVAHSNIEFSVKHMMFSTVRGSFKQFDATVVADPEDLTSAEIEFTIDVASIDTGNNDRDVHLRSADFFDVEKFPKITFQATQIVKTGADQYDVTGDLTLHGVTRSETFKVTFEGQGKDPWGNEKVGFSAQGKLNRSDYGLTWNAALETGGVLVSDQVKFELDIQAAKQA
ncbi:polyisoprenoid-binding protein [Alicyclobacillus contaminans]|uniref:YceI family protein n=1 Tax=Alicyclobacillus contaminans TaxID=392016 RepID=UPI00040C8CF7|nr:YceI family protein [Alicyclobacillus contaminans]GMA52201.1 polyisoprenoid-binding protein [Alicyclobacillus contaminans]